MKTPNTFSFLTKRPFANYKKLCSRLQKKWKQRTWHLLSPSQQQHFLKRLHRYELQLQRMGIAASFSLFFLGGSLLPLQAQTPMPVKGELQVNNYTLDYQEDAKVAMDSEGNFVITWESNGQDGDEYGIYAQQYAKNGTKINDEFQVNTHTIDSQDSPTIAMDSDGDFVIVWESSNQDGDRAGIYAQRYNNLAEPQGSEFQVNTETENAQDNPNVAMDEDGDFVVVWDSRNQDGSLEGIYAQRFNNLAEPQGLEFQVNEYTTSFQTNAEIAMDSDGDFVVTWTSNGQDGENTGVFARRYNNLGLEQGDEFQVNQYTTSTQESSSIAMNNNGNFIIVWDSRGQDGDGRGIYARRYDGTGNAVSDEFLVNTFTTNTQLNPDIAMDNTGNFIITWDSRNQDGDNGGVYAQYYNSQGIMQGDEFLVNTETDNTQGNPNVALNDTGNIVITWDSFQQNIRENENEIYVQRFTTRNTDVPTLSEWGLLNLALLLMICGTLYLLQPNLQEKQF